MRVRTFVVGTCLLVAAGFLAAPVGAQENRLGLVGGLAVAQWGGDDVSGADSRLGFDVGAFFSWALREKWAIRPGLYYVEKGVGGEQGPSEFDVRVDYVELPLLLEFRVPTTTAVGVHLFAGPAVAFEVGCEVEERQGDISGTEDCDGPDFLDLPDSRAMDVGAMLGGGFRFAAGDRIDVVVEASYNLGLRSIDDTDAGADIKNRVFQANAGVTFLVGR